MKIRKRIIVTALAVIVGANGVYSAYFLDRERRAARARLETAIEENNRLLGSVIAGPLYDGNIEQLIDDLDSFLLNPDVVSIMLSERRGDIAITREGASPTALGELIEDRVRIVRGIDELGEILVTYTTANIERRLIQSRNEFILLSVVSVLTLTGVIFFAARGLTKPIDRLTEAARAMANGRLDQQIEPGGAAEVVDLGQSFVRMRDAIRAQLRALEEKNQLLSAEIAQRREAEQERDRLSSIIEATTDLVSMADPRGNILYLNRAGRVMAGIGDKPLSELNIPDFHPSWASDLVLNTGIPTAVREGYWSGDTALQDADGVEIPVSQVILSHCNSDGEVEYMSTTIRDISERKLAEAELKRFKTTLDLTQDCVFMFDPDTLRFFYVNQGAIEQVGYRADELMCMTPVDIKPDFDESSFRALIAPMLAGERSSISFETRHRHLDGHDIDVEIFLQYVAPAGERPRFVAIVRDITERKRAVQALRIKDRAIAGSINGIAFADPSGTLTYVNQTFLNMWGYKTEEEVAGRSLLEFWKESDPAARLLNLLGRQDGWSGEMVAERSNGTEFIALVSASVVRDVNDQPVHFMASFLDITERKRAEDKIRMLNATLEQRVRERTAELEAANEELEAFSYSVSHDLRAPLRAIDGFSRVLVEDYGTVLDAEAQGYLKRVRRAVQRMGDLIDDLLQLARVSRAELRPERVDLSNLARDIVSELREAAPARRVDVSIAPDLNARGDARLLHVVLANLLDNAWKYTGKREHARIEFGGAHQDGETVYHVRDNGAGFDMQYVGKLFSAFQRLHTEREFPGTGVGLATVARIVHRHGGRVWAEGELGEGATFFFTLGRASATP